MPRRARPPTIDGKKYQALRPHTRTGCCHSLFLSRCPSSVVPSFFFLSLSSTVVIFHRSPTFSLPPPPSATTVHIQGSSLSAVTFRATASETEIYFSKMWHESTFKVAYFMSYGCIYIFGFAFFFKTKFIKFICFILSLWSSFPNYIRLWSIYVLNFCQAKEGWKWIIYKWLPRLEIPSLDRHNLFAGCCRESAFFCLGSLDRILHRAVQVPRVQVPQSSSHHPDPHTDSRCEREVGGSISPPGDSCECRYHLLLL